MTLKFNSRSDQVGQRNQLERFGVMAQSEQERMQLDTERMEQEIRMLNPDATHEDYQFIAQGIAQVQGQVRSKMNQVLENSRQVTHEMLEFEEGAEAAAERAREDAQRMDALRTQIHNRNDFETQVEYIRSQKQDSAAFQGSQSQQMKSADDELQRVVERTQQAVNYSLNRSWG